jgi:cytosine/adenosine deaminase-related metal-dependent hydrolase
MNQPETKPVDLLITGCQVVCFDQADTIIEDGAIAIDGNSIAWLGKATDALPAARETLHAPNTIAMPGLIDCHVHTTQQFLHGKLQAIQRRGALRNPMWQRYLIPFESGLTPDDVYASGLAAYAAMIRSGTTCFLEAGGPFADQMGRAADEIGIRGRIAPLHHGYGRGPAGEHALLHRRSATPIRGVGAALERPSSGECVALAAPDHGQQRRPAPRDARAFALARYAHSHSPGRGYL